MERKNGRQFSTISRRWEKLQLIGSTLVIIRLKKYIWQQRWSIQQQNSFFLAQTISLLLDCFIFKTKWFFLFIKIKAYAFETDSYNYLFNYIKCVCVSTLNIWDEKETERNEKVFWPTWMSLSWNGIHILLNSSAWRRTSNKSHDKRALEWNLFKVPDVYYA